MEIKLRVLSTSYKENEAKKTVTAIIHAVSVFNLTNQSYYGLTSKKSIVAVGVAKCCDGDVYDVEKGKKVARAKAELNAYRQHKKHNNEIHKFLSGLDKTVIKNHWKVGKLIQHQEEYIKSF